MKRAYLQQLSPLTPAQAADRRSFARHEINLNAVLCVHGAFQMVVIEDVSRGGMKLKHATDLGVGDQLTIELLNQRHFHASVAWVAEPYAGITFAQPLPEDESLCE